MGSRIPLILLKLSLSANSEKCRVRVPGVSTFCLAQTTSLRAGHKVTATRVGLCARSPQ